MQKDPIDLCHQVARIALALPAEVVTPIPPVRPEHAPLNVAYIRHRIAGLVQLRRRANVNRRGDGSREVGSALKAELDDAISEFAAGDREWRHDRKCLTVGCRNFPHLVAKGPKLFDESRGPVHQDTGVGELWKTTKCSPLLG